MLSENQNVAIVVFALVFAVFLFAEPVIEFKQCVCNATNYYAEHKSHKHQTLSGGVLGEWSGCAWTVIHAHADPLIALFTIILAFVTTWLAFVTYKLANEAANGSEIAKQAAQAALKSADIAERSLVMEMRAYVYGAAFNSEANVVEGRVVGYFVYVEWTNSGNTPAIELKSWIEAHVIEFGFAQEPFQTDSFGAMTGAVVGPGTIVRTPSRYLIPIDVLILDWNRTHAVYLLARVEYKDVFQPEIIHHHEMCVRLEMGRDPRTIPTEGVASWVRFTTFGPRNTSD